MRQKAALLAAMVLLVLLPGRQGIPLGEHQLLGEDWFLDQPYEGNPVEVLKKLMLNGGQGKRGDLPWPTVDQYLSAAGWSVGDDLIRLPIVFIPPFSGTRLLQRLEDRPIKTPLDVWCERDTAGEWQSMWLPSPGTKSESPPTWPSRLVFERRCTRQCCVTPRSSCCPLRRPL
jgi:hypothetical protein